MTIHPALLKLDPDTNPGGTICRIIGGCGKPLIPSLRLDGHDDTQTETELHLLATSHSARARRHVRACPCRAATLILNDGDTGQALLLVDLTRT